MRPGHPRLLLSLLLAVPLSRATLRWMTPGTTIVMGPESYVASL